MSRFKAIFVFGLQLLDNTLKIHQTIQNKKAYRRPKMTKPSFENADSLHQKLNLKEEEFLNTLYTTVSNIERILQDKKRSKQEKEKIIEVHQEIILQMEEITVLLEKIGTTKPDSHLEEIIHEKQNKLMQTLQSIPLTTKKGTEASNLGEDSEVEIEDEDEYEDAKDILEERSTDTFVKVEEACSVTKREEMAQQQSPSDKDEQNSATLDLSNTAHVEEDRVNPIPKTTKNMQEVDVLKIKAKQSQQSWGSSFFAEGYPIKRNEEIGIEPTKSGNEDEYGTAQFIEELTQNIAKNKKGGG